MYSMEPKDTLHMVHDHQRGLRDQVSRERLAHAAQATRPDGGRQESPSARLRDGFRAGAGRLFHTLVAGQRSAG